VIGGEGEGEDDAAGEGQVEHATRANGRFALIARPLSSGKSTGGADRGRAEAARAECRLTAQVNGA